jgi:hypothetical protein
VEYAPFLSPKADETFQQFPAYLQDAISSRIAKICAAPSQFSRPAVFPYHPNKGMISILQYPVDDNTTDVVTIFFRFSQDESRILISDFGHYTLDGPGDPSLYERS